MIRQFLELCAQLGVPVSMDKTEWASEKIIFLGIMLDGYHLILAIPEEKKTKGVELITEILAQKKTTMKKLQQLCGFLNFLGKAIFPGRPFTRRMYAKYAHLVCVSDAQHKRDVQIYKWKQHYHVHLDKEFKLDCEILMGTLIQWSIDL